jgi:enoyl-CoA hydratase/carnithine racemase
MAQDEAAIANDDDLLVTVKDGVARITLNRPEVLNALSAAHFRQLTAAILDVGWRPEVGVVVLTGAGRAFSAGGDLRTLSKDVLVHTTKFAVQTLMAIRQCPRPVVAVLNGDAVAGGNELVIACDFAIASSSARLGHAGTRLGWAPILGATNVFTTQIGEKRANEIVYLSKIVPAATALEWGWINEVVDPADLGAAEKRWCDELLAKSPEGLQLAKASSNFWWDLAYASMAPSMAMLHMGVTPEAADEGIRAFQERRPADWSPWRQ